MESIVQSFPLMDRKRKREVISLCASATMVIIDEALKTFPGLFRNSSGIRMIHGLSSTLTLGSAEEIETQEQEEEIHMLIQRILSICGESSQLIDSRWVHPRSIVWFDRFLSEVYDDKRWVETLRVSRTTFTWLCDQVGVHIEKRITNWRLPIPIACRVGAALYRLAKGADLSEVADKFGIGKSSAHYAVKEFVRAVNKSLSHHISWSEGDSMEKVIKGFEEITGLPNCCGVLDATHLCITKPPGVEGADYYNSNQTYSIVLQGVCDTNWRFLDAFCGFPGSVRDSKVLKNSGLYRRVEAKEVLNGEPIFTNSSLRVDQYLLGDAGYPCLPWLLVPFPGKELPFVSENYNEKHAIGRLHIKQAFGILKRIFTILRGTINQKVSFIPELVFCCCILHNIVLSKSEVDVNVLLQEIIEEESVDAVTEDYQVVREGDDELRTQLAHMLVYS
eukprot:Gb_03106 [translate_table: standard]